MRPAPPCRAPGCPERAVNGSFCAKDAKSQGRLSYQLKGSRRERGYPADWEKRRLRILRRDPVCLGCAEALSSEVDHLLPLDRGGSNDDSNLQGLCKGCHSRKTALEARDLNPDAVMAAVRDHARKERAQAAEGVRGVKSLTQIPFGTVSCPKTNGREIPEGGDAGKIRPQGAAA
jgi:5-methylcytosine-specific restriction protein A